MANEATQENQALKQEIQEALHNKTLGRTLGNFCATYPERRLNSYKGVDFEETQQKIKEVKSYAADHVDEMIEEFTKNCTARGGHVLTPFSFTRLRTNSVASSVLLAWKTWPPLAVQFLVNSSIISST